jgi:hypothetical protein
MLAFISHLVVPLLYDKVFFFSLQASITTPVSDLDQVFPGKQEEGQGLIIQVHPAL